jgi:hypothetical protein
MLEPLLARVTLELVLRLAWRLLAAVRGFRAKRPDPRMRAASPTSDRLHPPRWWLLRCSWLPAAVCVDTLNPVCSCAPDQLVEVACGDALHVGLPGSAVRRGSRKPEKYEPFLSLGMCSSMLPARVSQTRSRKPLRWFMRAGVRSPWPAPHRPSTSSAIAGRRRNRSSHAADRDPSPSPRARAARSLLGAGSGPTSRPYRSSTMTASRAARRARLRGGRSARRAQLLLRHLVSVIPPGCGARDLRRRP